MTGRPGLPFGCQFYLVRGAEITAFRLDVGIKNSGGQVSDSLVEPRAKGGVMPLVVICINLIGHSYLSRVVQA